MPTGCIAATSASSRSSWPPSPAAPAAGPRRIARPPAADRRRSSASPEPDAIEQLLDARRRCRLRRHARRSALRRRPGRPRSRQARADREAVGPVACRNSTSWTRWPGSKDVLAKVVYHKLLDPDHKKLRTLVADGVLQHVNNGYCSLLEPKSISGSQFAEWITGRNPGTYVAVHYIKLIDFTFGGRLKQRRLHRPARPRRPGRRPDLGLDAAAAGLRIRRRPRGGVRHPHQLGHARQLPRLRRAGSAVPLRQRRLERPSAASAASKCTVEGRTPLELKITIEQPLQRHVPRTVGRALAARLRHRGARAVRRARWPTSSSAARRASAPSGSKQMRALAYNDLAADRQTRRRRAGDGSDPRPARRRARRTASSKSTTQPAGWCC